MVSSSPDLMRPRDDSTRGLSSRVGFLLAQLGTHRHRRFAERLAPLDLHPRHFGIISHLAANEGQSQQALSRTLGLHRSATMALRWSPSVLLRACWDCPSLAARWLMIPKCRG